MADLRLKGAKPTMDLKSIAHYFMDQLDLQSYHSLKALSQHLDNKVVKVGTTCSGIESGSVVVENICKALSERFIVNICSQAEFACELHEEMGSQSQNKGKQYQLVNFARNIFL